MERREHERYPVRPLDERGIRQETSHRVTNISKSGCSVQSNQPLGDLDAKIRFELPLPTRSGNVMLSARIVWSSLDPDGDDGVYRCGVVFAEMDRVSDLILDAYLDFLRRDVHIARLEKARKDLQEIRSQIDLTVAVEEKKKAPYLH